MRAKAMKLSYILPLLMMGGATFFTGCEQGKDLYNPESVQERAKKAFPVKDIDPNHTWETSTLCNATVSVNEKSGDTYTIKVYTANPYNTNGNAALLATATVADGKTVNFKFDIPAALQQVYVMKVDEAGYSAAVPATVENGVLKVDFGGKNATATRTVMTRNAITRAELWTPEELPTEAPDGTGYLKDLRDPWNDVKENENYIVDSQINDVNVGKPVNLYIKGEVTLKHLYINGNAKIYILPDAKLTLEFEQTPKISMIEIGIAKDGILEAKKMESLDNLQFDSNSYLYNCGEINAKSIQFTNNAQLYNMGKVNTVSSFECANGQNVVQNYSEINAGAFNLSGSSALYNYGEVNITGHSVVNSNGSIWDNGGTFKTISMEFVSTSPYWINRCKLIVEGALKCQFGDGAPALIMDKESYAECQELYFNNATIKMRSKAYFNVKGEATFGHSKSNQGFIGAGEEPALLRMNSATSGENFPSIRYHDNLYVACNNHFVGKEDKFYEFTGNAKMTKSDGADITIPKSECNPGYGGTPDGGGNNDKVINYTYGFEDMTNGGDYDFNDVVLCVSAPHNGQNGKKVIDVTLKAAGASKALSVYLDNVDNPVFDDVHTALGVEEGILVNTGRATGEETTRSIEVSENFNLTENGDFYICDKLTGRKVHIPKFDENFETGNSYVPYAIRVASTEWKWPKESISIDKAYLGFTEWAQDSTQEPDWYEAPVEENVISNN